MKKRDLIIYRVVTVLFSLFILMGAIMYVVKHEMTSDMFANLGFPSEMIYPLAIVKLLGIVAIWFIKNSVIKKLAFLGFAVELILAMSAHLYSGHGEAYGPIIPLILLVISYAYYVRIDSEKAIV